jgi:hypothetical protein
VGLYRFKSPPVNAMQFRRDGPLPPYTRRTFAGLGYLDDGSGDSVDVTDGDWVCWMEAERWVVSDNEFIEKYERIDPEPAKEEHHRAVDLDGT